jgi:hypothetical protein
MGERGHIEPSLDELFGDDAIQLLMRRDGVTESEVRVLLAEVREALTAAPQKGAVGRPVLVSTTSCPSVAIGVSHATSQSRMAGRR